MKTKIGCCPVLGLYQNRLLGLVILVITKRDVEGMVDSCEVGGVTFSCKVLSYGEEAYIGEAVACFPLESFHSVIVVGTCFSSFDGYIA